METKNEIPKYDWVPNERWQRLIYVGRKPDHIDPGCGASDELLLSLFNGKKLTGQALLDANEMFSGVLLIKNYQCK